MRDQKQKLRKLSKYFSENPIPENFTEVIKKELRINLEGKYGPYPIENPILVAPGQLTTHPAYISKIKKASYAGCVLKSVVGEDENGNCSMISQRKAPTYIKTVYDSDDKKRIFPIIQWDGRLDPRSFSEYLAFAKEAKKYSNSNFLTVISILCHLPLLAEDFKKEEWIYTTKALFNLGYKIFEIDFCPHLQKEDEQLMKKENILRWYKTVPSLMKSVSSRIIVYPKLLNLDFGLEFQVQMVEASLKGKADGIVIGNRIFKEIYNSTYGGRELRERNLSQVREIVKIFPGISISATGGVYSGKHIFNYLCAGAENVQLLSFIMGRVNRPFSKNGNKFEKVFHKLLLDTEDGFISCMLKQNCLQFSEILGRKRL